MAGAIRAQVVPRVSSVAAALVGIPVAILISAPPAAAANITTACQGTTSGSTFTLSANCTTTEPLTVPNGFTINGAGPGAPARGYTISATDPVGGQWSGGSSPTPILVVR